MPTNKVKQVHPISTCAQSVPLLHCILPSWLFPNRLLLTLQCPGWVLVPSKPRGKPVVAFSNSQAEVQVPWCLPAKRQCYNKPCPLAPWSDFTAYLNSIRASCLKLRLLLWDKPAMLHTKETATRNWEKFEPGQESLKSLQLPWDAWLSTCASTLLNSHRLLNSTSRKQGCNKSPPVVIPENQEMLTWHLETDR